MIRAPCRVGIPSEWIRGCISATLPVSFVVQILESDDDLVNSRRSGSASVSVTCIEAIHLQQSHGRTGANWCEAEDLNPQDLRHENLNLACLPVPPRPLKRARALEGLLPDTR